MRQIVLILTALAAFAFACPSAFAQQKAQVSGMQNAGFGQVANLQVDATRSINLCVYTSSLTYSVTALGDTSGGRFSLSGAAGILPYEVQWAANANSSSGTQLQPATPLTSQTSVATQKTCNNGPPYSASLIIKLRATDLGVARAGDYSGSLSIVIAAE